MIGLEFIVNLYNKQFKDVAEELGISKQVVNGWIKGRYNISKKHLPKLSQMFNISEEYFQKKLNDVDKLTIQQMKIRNELNEYEYEDTFTDDETGEQITVTRTQPDQEQLYENNFLEFKKNIIKLHNTIDGTISGKFRNGVIDNDINLNADLFEAERLLELYEMFVGIIKREKISLNTIERIFKGMRHYEGIRSLATKKDVLAISELVKQIQEGKKL
ncbi:XRE family transcriptional regulator [Clostridium botulinum]|nr:XRE family transcriptional regulator [Clostridium botulinum]